MSYYQNPQNYGNYRQTSSPAYDYTAPAMSYSSSTDSNGSTQTSMSMSSMNGNTQSWSQPQYSSAYSNPYQQTSDQHYGYQSSSPGTVPSQSSSMSPRATKSDKSTGLKGAYHCLEPGCESSFTRAADLKRHLTTVHFPYKIDCPEPGCARKGENGFAAQRTDHLNEHRRQVHGSNVPKREYSKKSRRPS
ncbi:hypothetical protein FQN54_002598 [Arachnomyces sp. PD_36]|nr:hypothetical protein FQN54_002598 [Arachnomyces sp. PD_36]